MKKSTNKFSQIGDAGFLLIANLIVNIGNYGLNIVLGRWLGPEGFADANLLATLVMLLSFVAMGLQLVIAKYSAEYKALKEDHKLFGLLSVTKKSILKYSLILSALLLVCTPLLESFFNFNAPWSFIILIIGIPSYFLMSASRGFYQGTSSFRKLAGTYLVEMIVRLFFTVALLFIVGKETFSAEIVAIGFLLSFLVTHLYSRVKTENAKVLDSKVIKQMLKFFAVIGVYELSQILINNSDVILVKHFFSNADAGLYSSLALLGRAVFFATWIVVTMLFPKVIEKEKTGEPHQHLFWNALAIVGFIGLSIVSACYLLDDFIINIAFGKSYLSISHLLWMYALSTTLFAAANVVVYYNMSLENYIPVWISVAAGILQIIAISLFHESLTMIIQIQMILMSGLLGIMLIYQKTKGALKSTKQIKLLNNKLKTTNYENRNS